MTFLHEGPREAVPILLAPRCFMREEHGEENMDAAQQLEALTANAAEVIPREELETKLRTGRPLRVKHGVDPTAPHVHLGWSVPLRKLRQFQELGHIAVLVLG